MARPNTSVVDNWYELDDDDAKIPIQIPIEKEIELIKLEYAKLGPDSDLTLLMFASKIGNENAVLALIKSGESVNEKCSKGLTALSHAIISGHFKCVQTLVANCADVNCTDQNGDTPLILAAKLGFDDIVQCLLTADARKTKKSHTILCTVALNGDLKCLQTLIKAGINLNVTDSKGLTVLMRASAEGLFEVVECLIHAAPKVNLQCKEGKTALSYAASNGHLQCVEILHSAKAHLNLADCDGLTPLMKAAMNGHSNVVNYLVNYLEEDDFNTVCKKGKTAFYYAAEFGHLECVKIFISRCKVNIDVKDYEDQTALMKALFQNHSGVVEYLLWNGARCDTVWKDGMNVIHCAATVGNIDSFQNVVIHDKRNIQNVVNLQDAHGQTPLMIAAVNRHDSIVNYLLQIKADVNLRCNKSWNALHYASHGGKFSCIKSIARAQVNVNVQTEDGHTCLMIASMKGMHTVVSLLISLKADVNMQCSEGRSALHYAVLRNSSKCIEELLKADAHINLRDKHGESPLILAARTGRNKMVELLIQHGANVDIQNNDGRTALHCAKLNGTLKSFNLLRSANPNMLLKDKENKTALETKRGGNFKKPTFDGVDTELAGKLEKLPTLKDYRDFNVV